MYTNGNYWIFYVAIFKGKNMKAYLDLLQYILENGEERSDRTNTGTISSFGHQFEFDLEKGFPAVTTKSLAWKGVVSELLWFLEGSDDERRLAEIRFNKDRSELTNLEKYSTIWTDNADNQGKELGYENSDTKKILGPVYGVQWRNWCGVDQIKNLLNGLEKNPDGRRHILSAWNVSELNKMALPPCHVMSQFYIHKNSISCHMYQRSADMFLGVPFNIASYALLLSIIAKILNLKPKRFIHSFGDAHIYKNTVEQVMEQISREPKPLPKLVLPDINSLDDLKKTNINDYVLDNYDPHPAIKAKMAI
jgi:thymidylate synthase|tara:strand:+ start:8607 stop:9527 length:921 start_codon:yes stop_codon:yes gene_type:complete